MRVRRSAVVVAGLLLAALVAPAVADAHGGLVGRSDLPIPGWLFGWAASAVLVVSFVALAALWPKPVLEDAPTRKLPPGLSRALTAPMLEAACGAIGVALFALVIWSGLEGTTAVAANFASNFVFVIFWVGLVFASALLGDVYRLFNPWRALGRGVGWLAQQISPTDLPPSLPYPEWLGRWPAVAGLVAFTVLELVSSAAEEPRSIAIAALVYSAAMAIGMLTFGVETWSTRGDGFAVYFNLFSRMSVFERDGRDILIRRPLAGLAKLEPMPGTVAVLMVMIGSVSFDGAGGGSFYQGLVPDIKEFWTSVGFNLKDALELTFATGYVAAIAIVAALYRLGVFGAARAGARRAVGPLARSFAHSLVPIAFAYAGAHYISLLVYQSQGAFFVASDPGGKGWDLFGTAGGTIDYSVISASGFWYIQVALVVGGHIAGLMVAHDRALVLYERSRDAVRSQYWLLTVMIIFTSLALWLLSQQNEG